MKVIKIYDLFRNDCTMDQECEHCGRIETDKSAYNDHYFINNVVPGRFCKTCGKNQAGEIKSTED